MRREIFKRGVGGKIKRKFGAIRQVRIAITFVSIVACLLLAGLPAGQLAADTQTDTFTTSGTFTAPAGVYQITVEAWAGGGGGGGRYSSSTGGAGGGGGGAYARATISVTPGQNFTVTVGTAGAGGSGTTNVAGSPGGDSSFGDGSLVLARGGSGGTGGVNGTGGAGGAAGSSIGDVKYSGGNGGTGTGTTSGGGGGGAGNATAGGNATGATAGTGGTAGGGIGGAGRTSSSSGAGNAGSTLGGGGSGAYRSTGGPYSGGSGARGEVRITYTTATFTTSGTFTVPAGVYEITVEAWAGGGAGGGRAASGTGGAGGGGGGAYARTTISVTPGQNYAVTVGTGGTGVSGGSGNPGGDSYFGNGSQVSAKGGSGGTGTASGAGGAGGAAGSSNGTVKYSGGTGGTGSSTVSGGGGGGAGNTSAGGSASGATAGTGGTAGGGNGAAGRTGSSNGAGSDGSTLGGGGSGAYRSSTGGPYTGGAGARGEVRITYNPIPDAPVLYSKNDVQIAFNNIRQNTTTPTFRVSATHTGNFTSFKVELNTASDFTGTAYRQTFTGTYSSGGQYNLVASSLSPSLPTTNNATYYVRVRASADAGGHWSDWSTVNNPVWTFTYKSSGEIPDWFQTTDAQFGTGTLSNTTTSGSDSVRLGLVTSNNTWGDTTGEGTTYDETQTKYMGGTSPNVNGMVIREIRLYCAATGTFRLAVYQGGTLGNPVGASLVWDAGTVAVSGTGWYSISGGSASLAPNQVTWIGFKTNSASFVYSTSWDTGSNFQSGRGRWQSTSESTTPTTAWSASIPSGGGFDDYWYDAYIVYDQAASSGTITSPAIDFAWVPGATNWGVVQVGATTATNNSITVQVLNSTGAPISGKNVTIQNGGTSGSINLTDVPPTGGNATLRLRATLTNSGGGTPYLDDWMVTWVAAVVPSTITVTAPSAIAFDTLVWGNNIKPSATNGSVTVVFGSGSPSGWQVTAQDVTNGGYMKKGATALLSGKLQISGNGTGWAYADVGITYTNTTEGTYPLPFWAKQVINTNEAVGFYNITIVFTAEIVP